MENLKPCPFCGSEEVVPYYTDENGIDYVYEGEEVDGEATPWIHCHGCDADWFAGEKKEDVIAAWNRRAVDDDVISRSKLIDALQKEKSISDLTK